MVMKEVLLLSGAGQIGMAIARRIGYGKTVVIGDKAVAHAQAVARTMNQAGFDCAAAELDLSSRDSILSFLEAAQARGPISGLINAAGVSPSQASVETILQVDLYGTAVLLEEAGKIISSGGAGVTISSQSGHRMPALTPEEVAGVAELLMGSRGAFITGADFLVDGGATASYFYGPLKP